MGLNRTARGIVFVPSLLLGGAPAGPTPPPPTNAAYAAVAKDGKRPEQTPSTAVQQKISNAFS